MASTRTVLQIQLQVKAPPHIPAQPHLGANGRADFLGSERDDCACVQAATDAPRLPIALGMLLCRGRRAHSWDTSTPHTHMNEEPVTLPSYS